MRELSIQIKFTNPSLGNQKDPKTGRFCFQRSPGGNGKILFLATWWQSSMKLAAEMLGKHLETVKRIYWDIEIDAELRDKCLTRCYYVKSPGGRQRWSLHESLVAGQVVGINCAVPDDLSDDDFWSLLQLVGRYKGISPWKPGQYGHFDVVSIKPRRNVLEV